MSNNIISILTLLILLIISDKVSSAVIQPDVTSYYLTIEPNIDKGTIIGSVVINFQIDSEEDSVIFKSGNLEIESVKGDNVKGHKKINNDLIVYLSKRDGVKNKIVVDYHGSPKKGLIFDPESSQAYTCYFTSSWMICNDLPEERDLLSNPVSRSLSLL